MNKKLVLGVVAALAISMYSCDNSDSYTVGAPEGNDSTAVNSFDDLALYELNGNVKRVVKTSYFDVDLIDGQYKIDSIGKNVFESVINFDKDGKYVPRADEVVKRDAAGHIVYWEDHRPNAEHVSGGFLKDTLQYKYVNGNHLVSSGMGNYSVVVYDDDHKIVGQYSVPSFNYSQNCAFNVYKKFDKKGNWTERVTIWSTQGKDAKKPSLKYSIDRREINYY